MPFYRIWQPLPSKKFNIFLTAWSAVQGGKKMPEKRRLIKSTTRSRRQRSVTVEELTGKKFSAPAFPRFNDSTFFHRARTSGLESIC
ncbi:MAG: hypothetical protein DME49_04720 [Verrucomicrobia bacterium]|nr:MAG: hypothetical protein DME49_04720 [Verrucomicrobiota bacterium]